MAQIEVLYVGGSMHGEKTKVDSRAELSSAMVTQPDRITIYSPLLVTDENGDEVQGWYVMDCLGDELSDEEIVQAIYAADLQPVVQGIRVRRQSGDEAD